MLRRKPTAIVLTNEDIITYDEVHRKRVDKMKGSEEDEMGQDPGQNLDPNDELRPLPGDKARLVRSRAERIGGPAH
ncbi:MAG: hypothetical protein M1829_005213 [Trizodia sp. TS-e1964]|nr:MAG: hypothetical protein M1829_005213 [Trizodia sp. TS-e1964]